MTDAAHMLSDFAGFLISLFAIWVASRPPSKRMSFGWHRAGVCVCVCVYVLVCMCMCVCVWVCGCVGEGGGYRVKPWKFLLSDWFHKWYSTWLITSHVTAI